MRLEDMTWEEVKDAAERGLPVIVPSGAITQYGPHLPLGTNSLIVHELALRVSERVETVVAPPHWYGFAYPKKSIPGNVTIPPEVLTDYLFAIGKSLTDFGFRKFLFLLGQLPNLTALNRVAQLLVEYRDGVKVGIAPWWSLGKKTMKERFADDPGYHAMAAETALVLALKPTLVRKDRVVDEMPSRSLGFDFYPRPEQTETRSGVVGKPSLATIDAGEALVSEIVGRIEEILTNDF